MLEATKPDALGSDPKFTLLPTPPEPEHAVNESTRTRQATLLIIFIDPTPHKIKQLTKDKQSSATLSYLQIINPHLGAENRVNKMSGRATDQFVVNGVAS
jgi:hypothetical protein